MAKGASAQTAAVIPENMNSAVIGGMVCAVLVRVDGCQGVNLLTAGAIGETRSALKWKLSTRKPVYGERRRRWQRFRAATLDLSQQNREAEVWHIPRCSKRSCITAAMNRLTSLSTSILVVQLLHYPYSQY